MNESYNAMPGLDSGQTAANDVFIFPASFAQQRLWFLDKLDRGQNAYNVPFAVRLSGNLNISFLELSLRELIARHEVLRTTFSEDEAGKPIQVVASRREFALPVTDLRGGPSEGREQEARRRTIEHARLAFDLKEGPLFRASLIRLADTEHVLSLAFHHTIVDGWSLGILLRELSALYEAVVEGRTSPLPDLPIQYGDYASWQQEWLQGERLADLLAYWKNQLQGAPPVLELPNDLPRPPQQTFAGARKSMVVSRPLEEALIGLSQKEGATLFMTLLAAFSVLLSRYSGHEDVVIASPISGRTRSELEGLIGFFVNTLALRADLSGNPSFRTLLARVRDTALQAYAYQDLPFEKLVEELKPERDLGRNPIVQVSFSFEGALARAQQTFSNLTVTPFRGAEGMTTKFDLSLNAAVKKDGLQIGLTYNIDLFHASTIEHMAEHFKSLLTAIAANPDCLISELPLLGQRERHQVVVEWNDTFHDCPKDVPLHRFIEEQVERTPDQIALIYESDQLTYRQLNTRANQLARHLLRFGVGPDVLVGVCLERSVDMVVALLAVLKAGGAYVPLDPEYPRDRLLTMLDDSAAAVVLGAEALLEPISSHAGHVLCLDRDRALWQAEDGSNLALELKGSNLAYAIYTSGSTGKPKGVPNTHQGIVNRLLWMQHEYQLDASDRVLQKTPYSFDVSVWEFFWPLMSGACLVVARPEGHKDPSYLRDLIQQENITTLHFVPSMLRIFLEVEGAESCASLRRVICSGEALPLDVQERFFQRVSAELHNLYGPTEAAVDVTYWPCAPGYSRSTVPIGRPIWNTQIYILDRWLQPVPIGVSGELHIGGVGLARGYLNRPQLTAEKFISNPFSTQPGARLYKTGDLCRFLPDGNIEYLGRIDHQVKLRGFRIELGEIESVLAEHEQINQSVVVVREDRPGNQQLVAYLVAKQSQGASDLASELRAFLSDRLPNYMVPSAFVVLDSLPLTPNGKVDRKALPEADFTSRHEIVQPRNEFERLLAGIWQELLGVTSIGVTENFFELGGHSLLATQMVSRIRRAMQVELPLRNVFEHPTIGELGRIIGQMRHTPASADGPPLVRVKRDTENLAEGQEVSAFPLSFAEQRLWMLDRLEPNSSAYNLPVCLRLQGELKVDALERSLEEILRRHEILRARFRLRDDQPEQCIDPVRPLSLPVTDLTQEPDAESESRNIVRRELQLPFDLAKGPLLRTILLKLATDDHVLLLCFHHIVFDGWSRGVLLRELATHYTAFTTGAAPNLPELEVQYTDFAVWQREYLSGERLDRQVNYWKEQLAGAPPHLDIPADHPRPRMQTFRGSQMPIVVPPQVTARLKELSRHSGVTLFMSLLGALSVLLSRYSSQEDLVIGSPIAGRNRAETENLIGFFVNTIPLRVKVEGNPTFCELLLRIRETTLNAYAHQDLPFEKLVEELKPERDLSRNPIFQTMFSLQNVPDEAIDLPGLKLSRFRAGQAINSKFDLSVMASELPETISVSFEYNTDLFEMATIERMQRHWLRLLEAIATDPECPVADLRLLAEAERHQVLVEWNDTQRNLSPEIPLHKLIEVQTERTLNATAVIDGTVRLSYGQLNARANQLARRLQKLEIAADKLVGVCMERSAEMIIAILGVLKAGGAYVPLDPAYPKNRLARILEDSRAPVLIMAEELSGLLPPYAGEVIYLDREWTAIAGEPEHNLDVPVSSRNLAYVLFTSGSTGRPKGVAIEHRNASVFVQWAQTVFSAEELGGTLFSTSICFDLSVFEMFVPLSVGGTVIVAENALSLPDLPAANEVRLINTVPSAIAELVRLQALPSSVLTVNLAGEALPEALARDLYEQSNIRKLYNLYGPTEDTTYSTYTLVPRNGDVTIGRPIANTQAYILDSGRQPVPVGVAGELYLAGDGLARGYFGRPDLTRERFVPNPFSDALDARMYRTGDRCRYRPDGTIEYMGRLDNQVKLRGFRIELGEIENLLVQHPGVQQAVVTVREDTPGDQRLVGYVAPAADSNLLALELRNHLKANLPAYMVPSALVMLEALPLTPNGKVDRGALPAPETPAAENGVEFVAPRTPTEQALATIWSEVLRVPAIGVHQDFFALGGHSLLATQVISRVHMRLRRDLPLRTLFEHPTIAELAAAVEEADAGPVSAKEPIGRADRSAFRVKRSSL